NFIKFLIATLLILLLVSACARAAPAEVLLQPTEAPADPTLEGTEPPVSSAEQGQISRDYVSLATKPDVPPQTINGVTARIDWAYADESRVAFQYTISGLDWPDGTNSDFMQSPRVTSATIPDESFNGAVGWGNLPVENGVIVGYIDQFLTSYEALDADEHPNIDLSVDIPVEGPSSVGPFHFEFTVPVLDGVKIENIDQTVVANNVSMTLKRFVLNPSYAEALICFQMPSAVDWGLTASTLTLGDKEYFFSGGGLMSIEGKDFSLTDPERCSSIGFDIPYDPSVTSVTLTVPKLLASVPEVIDEERVAAANQRLESTGIEFEYKNKDHGGDIVVLRQPEGWTNEQIYPLIWDALAEQYEGPWVFTVTIKR
ncbi:MAG TPA: hypothetical protein VFQ13_01755, partial [Anaerolineales bacterium]|nr:hypothetical protein [Anaerolineales bacterium]